MSLSMLDSYAYSSDEDDDPHAAQPKPDQVAPSSVPEPPSPPPANAAPVPSPLPTQQLSDVSNPSPALSSAGRPASGPEAALEAAVRSSTQLGDAGQRGVAEDEPAVAAAATGSTVDAEEIKGVDSPRSSFLKKRGRSHVSSSTTTEGKHQHQRQRQRQRQRQLERKLLKRAKHDDVATSLQTGPQQQLPPELLRELCRDGHQLQEIELTDVDARQQQTDSGQSNAALRNSNTAISRSQVHRTAGRIAKSANVSRLERRRHQITALAAEAAALQVARQTFPSSSVSAPRHGRRN